MVLARLLAIQVQFAVFAPCRVPQADFDNLILNSTGAQQLTAAECMFSVCVLPSVCSSSGRRLFSSLSLPCCRSCGPRLYTAEALLVQSATLLQQ